MRPADRDRFRRLADLAGHRVATLAATTAYQVLIDEQRKTGLIPVSYDEDVHPYSDLVAGRVDAVLLDNIIAARSLRRQGGFVIQPEPVATAHYVAVLAPADTALRDSINTVLRARMRDGSIERTLRKWGAWTTSSRRSSSVRSRKLRARTRERRQRPAHGPHRESAPRARTYRPCSARPSSRCSSRALRWRSPSRLRIVVAAGRIYGPPFVRIALTVYVEVTRGTPVLLQLFVIYYGLSSVVRLPAMLAAILGLGFNYAAYESEIYRAALEAIPRMQLEAARTLGLSEFQVLRLVRGPQALRLALAPMTNDFVALLKDSSLVSVITVVELTKQTAIYAANIGSWAVPGILCAIVYLAMSLPLSRFARRLERRWNAA